MAHRPKHHNVWILFKERYPDFALPNEPETHMQYELEDFLCSLDDMYSNKNYDDESADRFYEAYRYFEKLEETKNEDLEHFIVKLAEEDHPLNQGDYIANMKTYDAWLQCDYLELNEAAALAIGRNPEKIDELVSANDDIGIKCIKTEFHNALRILQRLKSTDKDTNRISPTAFLAWFNSYDKEKSKNIGNDDVQKNKNGRGRPVEYPIEMSLLLFLENFKNQLDLSQQNEINRYLDNIDFDSLKSKFGNADKKTKLELIQELYPNEFALEKILEHLIVSNIDLGIFSERKPKKFASRIPPDFGSMKLLENHYNQINKVYNRLMLRNKSAQ